MTHLKLLLLTAVLSMIPNIASAREGKGGKTMEPSPRPSTPVPTHAPLKYTCFKDFFIFKLSEETIETSNDSLTIRRFAPLYRFDDGGSPDFSNVVGEFTSIDALVPNGANGYSCQQSSMIGSSRAGLFFQDQVTATGICASSGPGNALQGTVAINGGLGKYGGVNGRMRFQCPSASCTVVVEACSWPLLPPGSY